MYKNIDVFTGEVKTGIEDDVLISHALGSCVAVIMYDARKKIGGLAHVMLPGIAPDKMNVIQTRYARNAIDTMLASLQEMGTENTGLETCLVGGGNVLMRNDDSLCRNIIQSIQDILKEKEITVLASALGGTKRRSVIFKIENGEIYITEDGSKEFLLWKSERKISRG